MLFFLPLLIFDFEPCQFSALLTTTLSVWLSIDYGPTEQSREFYFLHTCTHECRHESVHVSGAAQSQSHHSCWLLTQLPQPSGWDKNRPTFSRSIAEYTDPPPKKKYIWTIFHPKSAYSSALSWNSNICSNSLNIVIVIIILIHITILRLVK